MTSSVYASLPPLPQPHFSHGTAVACLLLRKQAATDLLASAGPADAVVLRQVIADADAAIRASRSGRRHGHGGHDTMATNLRAF